MVVVQLTKALPWANKLCAYVRCVFLFKNANEPATKQHTEPTSLLRINDNGAEPSTSENDETRRAKTTSQGKKNKKPFKEKKKDLASEATNIGRPLPVPFCTGLKQRKDEGRISNVDTFRRTKMAGPSMSRTLWGQQNQKATNYNQGRNNGRIKIPLIIKPQPGEERVFGKDNFQNTDKPRPSSTRSLWRSYSDFKNERGTNSLYCNQARNNGRISKHLQRAKPTTVEEHNLRNERFCKAVKVMPQTSSTPISVRLWSVDINEESSTTGSANGNEPANNEINRYPRTVCIEVNPRPADNETNPRPADNEINPRSSNNEINPRPADNEFNPRTADNELEINPRLANNDTNPRLARNDITSQPANREINPRTNTFSCILMFVTSVLVCVLMGVVQPLYAYVKRKWAFHMTSPTEQNEIVANSNQLEAQNRKEIDDGVGFQASLNAIRASPYGGIKCAVLAFYGCIVIAISTLKSKAAAIVVRNYSAAISQVTADQPDITSQEIRRSSSTEDLKGGKTVNISDSTQAVASSETPAENSGITKPSFTTNTSKMNDNLCTPKTTCINIQLQKNTSPRSDTCRNEPSSRKEKKQSNALPTIDHAHVTRPCEKQVKASNTGTVKKGAAPPSVSTSNVNKSAVKTAVGKEKKCKLKKAVTPAHVDLPAQTTYKAKEKVMPRLIPPSYVNAIARVKAHVQKQSSPKVGISNLITPVKVRDETKVSSSYDNDKRLSAEVQNVIEQAVRRGKRRNNELEPTSSDVQASDTRYSQCGLNASQKSSIEGMQNPLELRNATPATVTRPRKNVKRKAEGNADASSNYEPNVLYSATRTTQLAAQMPAKGVVDQSELMEVGASEELPLIIQPEAMEVNNELNDVEVSFEESRAAYYQRQAAANANVTEPLQSMETNAELQETEEEMEVTQEQVSTWNFFPFSLPSFMATPSQPEQEEMEITQEQVSSWNFFPFSLPSFLSQPSQPQEEEMEVTQEQGSSWNFFSFSLPSFLAGPFTSQPAAEEMETDAQLAAAMASNTEPEEMEICQEPFAMATPCGQPMDNKLPTGATGMGTPEAGCTLPQQQMMGIKHQPVDTCRQVASPFGELVDTKRPLASRVGIFGEAAMSMKIPPAEQPVMQPAMQSVMQPMPQQMMQPGVQPVVQQPLVQQQVVQPMPQQTMQPGMQPVVQQPVVQQVMQPAMQQVVQPMPQQMMQPGVQQVMQPAMQSVMQPMIQQHPQVNSGLESTLFNPSSVVQPTFTQNTSLSSEVREQDAALKTRNQMIMEQLQIVPSTVPAGHVAGDSDSDSEDDSDDENTPCSDVKEQDADHMTGNQLTTEQLQSVPPSIDPACYQADFYGFESGDDSDDEFELDLETIENFSYLEKSPDHAQLITKLLMDKEATEWHRGYQRRDSDSDDSDCGDKYELSELLDSESVGNLSDVEDELEISPEQAEHLAKLLAKKESALRHCNM